MVDPRRFTMAAPSRSGVRRRLHVDRRAGRECEQEHHGWIRMVQPEGHASLPDLGEILLRVQSLWTVFQPEDRQLRLGILSGRPGS